MPGLFKAFLVQISSQDVHNLLRVLQAEPGYSGQVVHREWLGPRAARYASVDPRLPAPLTAALAAQGISKLYTHQAAALQAARAGQHVGVITATASGKTLCYQLPLLEAALRDPRERALLLFPTKALAQDQLRSLRELTQAMPLIRSGIYDGDTPQAERATLRVSATLLLSNPDMLHLGILPNHQRWARFLGRLRYVVVDEAHTYRGVFGSNVALLLRRLRRLCAEYGGEPQFLLCSATIANPHEHLSALVGAPVAIVDDDGAPRGSREFVFWNPPLIETRQQGDRDIAKQDEAAWLSAEPDAPRLRASARAAHRLPVALSEQQAARQGQQLNQSPAAPKSAQSGARRSTNGETTAIFTTLVRHGVKSLAFTRARKVAELILRYAQEALRREAPELGGSIAAYRAGYLPEQRRRIE
jgi:DEAD/DEAH box helicase domain-containing protein